MGRAAALPFGNPLPGEGRACGRGGRIATTSLRTGLAMTPLRGVRADRVVRPYGRSIEARTDRVSPSVRAKR